MSDENKVLGTLCRIKCPKCGYEIVKYVTGSHETIECKGVGCPAFLIVNVDKTLPRNCNTIASNVFIK